MEGPVDALESQLNAIARELQALLSRKSVQENELLGELGQIDSMLARARAALQRERLESIRAPIEKIVYEQQLKRMLELVMDTEEAVRRGDYDPRKLDEARMLIDAVRGRLVRVRQDPSYWNAVYARGFDTVPETRESVPEDILQLVRRKVNAPFRGEGTTLAPLPYKRTRLQSVVNAFDTDGAHWAFTSDNSVHIDGRSVELPPEMHLSPKSADVKLWNDDDDLPMVKRLYQSFVMLSADGTVYVVRTIDVTPGQNDVEHHVAIYSLAGELVMHKTVGNLGGDYADGAIVTSAALDGNGYMWLVLRNKKIWAFDRTTLQSFGPVGNPLNSLWEVDQPRGCLGGLIWNQYGSKVTMAAVRNGNIVLQTIDVTANIFGRHSTGATTERNSLFMMFDDRLVEVMMDTQQAYTWPLGAPAWRDIAPEFRAGVSATAIIAPRHSRVFIRASSVLVARMHLVFTFASDVLETQEWQ